MKVLVTGANGFLGRHVVAALRQRDHDVRALVRPATDVARLGWPTEGIEIARADLRTGHGLEEALEGVKAVVHLAAAVVGDEDTQFASTAVGTEKLLAAMSGTDANQGGVRRLVLASSFSVYDFSQVASVLDEQTPLEQSPRLYQRDGYAIAKAWQERLCQRWAEAHDGVLTVLRPGFIWGPGNAELACHGQPVGPVYLTLAPAARLPLTYVENCADVFGHCLDHPDSAGQTFNIVDGFDLSNWDYLARVIAASGRRRVRVPVPYVLAYGVTLMARGCSRLVFGSEAKLPSILTPIRFEARFKPMEASNTRVCEALGWRPPIDLETCLQRTFADATPSSTDTK